MVDYLAATEAVATSSKAKTRKTTYNHWSNKDRFTIGKYSAANGHATTERKFSSKEKPLNESIARRFCKHYKDELKQSMKEKREMKQKLLLQRKGRPLMLRSLDEMVQRYLPTYRSSGGPVNSLIAVSIAKVLNAQNPQLNLDHIDLDSSSWAKSLFQRMGLTRRMKTTGKVEIPEGAKQEAELLYLRNIKTLVEEHNIPQNLILNLDQTPLKYVPVSHNTMAKKGIKSVAIAGSADKRSITGTFVITLNGDLLPLQLIYGGKTKQSLPQYKFPHSFSLSVNPNHFSNTEESIKIIDEIVILYVKRERENLENGSLPALLILDVFRGQMTSEVTNLLLKNNIFIVTVPNNMTHLFQPLDLTVNGHCKAFLKRKFTQWFAQQFDKQLSLGKRVEDARWITQFYDYMSTEDRSKVIINGWKKSVISDAVTNGSSSLPSLDPFQTIGALPQLDREPSETIYPSNVSEDFVNVREDDDDSDWGDNDVDFERNAFDFIIDDE